MASLLDLGAPMPQPAEIHATHVELVRAGSNPRDVTPGGMNTGATWTRRAGGWRRVRSFSLTSRRAMPGFSE